MIYRCSLCGKLGWQGAQSEDLKVYCYRVPDWEYLGLPNPATEFRDAVKNLFREMCSLARGKGIPKPPQKIKRTSVRSMRGKSYAAIKAETRIEDVAMQLTEMRPTSNGMKGVCPFHIEKTPSFHVWSESQQWRCFGACAQGGDTIDLMKKGDLL